MARNSLRDLAAAASPDAPAAPSVALPDDVTALLRERATLERRMARLAGQDGDPRFPVTTLDARRRADAAWGRARDRVRPGPSLERAPRRPDGPTAGVAPGAVEPEPRTGQRPFGLPLERTGLRMLETAGRRPTDELPAPRIRDIAAETLGHVAPPPLREAVAGADAMARAAERLDIRRGGSGDLDALREAALRLGRARREDARRDEARLDRPLGDRAPPATPAERRRADRDGPRDAARLERGRGRAGD